MFLSEPNFKVPFYRCFVLPQAPIKKPLYRQSTTVKTGMKSSPSPFLFWFYFMGSGGACGNLLLHGGCAYPAPHYCLTSFHFSFSPYKNAAENDSGGRAARVSRCFQFTHLKFVLRLHFQPAFYEFRHIKCIFQVGI